MVLSRPLNTIAAIIGMVLWYSIMTPLVIVAALIACPDLILEEYGRYIVLAMVAIFIAAWLLRPLLPILQP